MVCLFVSSLIPMTRGWPGCTTGVAEFLIFCRKKGNLSLDVFYEAAKFNSEESLPSSNKSRLNALFENFNSGQS